MENVKNRISPIGQLPSETLAHTATFFAKERDLINATAVCRHWRTTCLSYPLLWRNARGSSSEIQAYLERSGSATLDVELSHPSLVDLIAPHFYRLVGLTVRSDEPSSLSEFEYHLRHPIPTLHTFRISVNGGRYDPRLEFPLDLRNPSFSHVKKLELKGFLTPWDYEFPYVTELVLDTSPTGSINRILKTLEQFPALEKVHITFRREMEPVFHADVTTLPHVREMSLSMFKTIVFPPRLPTIFVSLRLPNLTSLRIQTSGNVMARRIALPLQTFYDRLPNFAELPELQVKMGNSSPELTLRSTSQATLKYLPGKWDYDRLGREVWGGLPLDSVQRMTVDMVHRPSDRKFQWFIVLLRDLMWLEHLELDGECEDAIQWLCREMKEGTRSLPIQTLTVRCGKHVRRQALRLKRLADAAGLTTTLVRVPDPGAYKKGEVETDPEGSCDESEEEAGPG